MERRTFLKLAGMGATVASIPVVGQSVSAEALAQPGLERARKKELADIGLNAAKSQGATYTDVRIGRYLNQFVFTREQTVQNIVNTESFGVGIRVIANGAWGFAATNDVTPDGVAKAAQTATFIAKANAKFQKTPVQLAPVKSYGEVNWKTPIKRNPFEVPISEKVDLLMRVNAAAKENGASFITSNLFFINEKKYFASSDGNYIDQDVFRVWTPFNVTQVNRESGKFETRGSFGQPVSMGYEYLDGDASGKVQGITTYYATSYDMVEDAINAAKEATLKHKAESVKPGKYDLVLEPSHLMLTIHESVGHPLELDRVLGYEANLAGTSFATLDKWQSKSFQYGSKLVNFVADKTQPTGCGTVGFDDDGVKTKSWDLVKDGVLVNYQAIRDQVHMLGEKDSHGCCFADNWSSIQFQRMPNVSLKAGTKPLSVDDLIKDVEKGIYIAGRGSYSIDQQRYNFQFGGQLFYAIENGKITHMLKDVAYQSNTQEFWNSCTAICDQRDYRLGGSFFDGKGQPLQVSPVSHGCATSRFNDVNVINTARNI